MIRVCLRNVNFEANSIRIKTRNHSKINVLINAFVFLVNCKQTLWIITASIALGALTKAKDDIWQRNIPLKFLKAVMDQPTLCESGYVDYDSCENAVPTNSAKRCVKMNPFRLIYTI